MGSGDLDLSLSLSLFKSEKKAHKHKELLRILYVGFLVVENKAEEAPPHKDLGSQIFMLGTPLILYVGSLHVLFRPLISVSKTSR